MITKLYIENYKGFDKTYIPIEEIKKIYFDSVATASVLFESRLRTICASLYVIKEGLLLVNFNGDSKILFD